MRESFLLLGFIQWASEINSVGYFAKMEIAMLQFVISYDDNAQSGLIVALRLPNWASRDRFQIAIAGDGVAMVMPGKKVFHFGLVK